MSKVLWACAKMMSPVLAARAVCQIEVVVRVFEGAVAAGGGAAVDVNDAERAAIGLRERNAALARALAQRHVVVAHERFAEAVRHAAGRPEVGPRAADEPLQRESGIGVEDVVVTDGDLQQQVGVSVAADADAVAGAVIVVVGYEVGAGKGPGIALGAEPPGEFDFTDGVRRIDDGLGQLGNRVAVKADFTGRFERADLVLRAERHVQVAANVPRFAERFVGDADLRKEVAGLGVRAVGPQRDAIDAAGIHGVRREVQPAVTGADVEADAIGVVHRDLAVENRGGVVQRDDLHGADVEIALFVLAVALGVVAEAKNGSEILREEADVARLRNRRRTRVDAGCFGGFHGHVLCEHATRQYEQ